MAAPSSLRVLCFGASITAGFHSWGLAYHPYAVALGAKLRSRLPLNTDVQIDVDGEPGDTIISGRYWTRLTARLGEHGSNSKYGYDWIILQAGGNDLAGSKNSAQIFKALQDLDNFILSMSSPRSGDSPPSKIPKLLALTVTETMAPSTSLRKEYEALNALIRGHEQPGYYVADVCRAIPYHDMDPIMQRKVWDDGLHMRPAGYDIFGSFVGERLLEIILSDSSASQVQETSGIASAKI